MLVTDGWPGCNGLVDVGNDRHLRINKSKHFAKNGVHVNGIESFWSFTKRRLAKFNGVKANFPLHLKDCEWRWGKDVDMMPEQFSAARSRRRSPKESTAARSSGDCFNSSGGSAARRLRMTLA